MERKVYEQMAKLDSQHWWFTARRRILDGVIERIVRPPKGARILGIGVPIEDRQRVALFAGDVELTAIRADLHAAGPGQAARPRSGPAGRGPRTR